MRFNLPSDLDFECTQCGRCCRDEWAIRVDGPSAEKLLQIDWAKGDPTLAGKPPFRRLPVASNQAVEGAANDLTWTVERKPCGSCVFLDPGNLCRIHKDLGLRAKPQVCQQFPFLFSETPEGVTVGLSHYCPGVKRREGATEPPLLRNLDEIQHLYAHALRVVRAPERILVDDDLPIGWEDHAAFESLADELLATGETPADGLVGIVVAAAMLADFLRTKKAGKAEAPSGAARDFVAGWRRMGVGRILALAVRQKPAPRTGRLLLRQFLSLVDLAALPGHASTRAATGLWVLVKELFGFGSFECAPLGTRVGVRAVRAVALPWTDPALARPFRDYARHALFRKRLLPPLGVRVGLNLLVLHVASARFVARARAASEGRVAATPEDVAQGIQLVEKHYATHSSLGDALATGTLRKLFRRMALSPKHARAVLES